MRKETETSLFNAAFLKSVSIILVITSVAKIWSAFGGAKVLSAPDPITGLAFGRLMMAAGIIELVAAVFCMFGNTVKLKIFIIAWLATIIVVYRIGLGALGWHKPCNCLGNFTDVMHISPHAADGCISILFTCPGKVYKHEVIYFPVGMNIFAMHPC
jgi:hypothetical protein